MSAQAGPTKRDVRPIDIDIVREYDRGVRPGRKCMLYGYAVVCVVYVAPPKWCRPPS